MQLGALLNPHFLTTFCVLNFDVVLQATPAQQAALTCELFLLV